MSPNDAIRPPARTSIGDTWLLAVAVLLAGYALAGRTFAYIGVAPLYMGEMTLGLGIAALLYSRCGVATLAALPNAFLALLMCWVIARTLPYIGEYGVDSLRDSVVVIYGAFALIMTAVLLERPSRLTQVIGFLRVLSILVVPLTPLLLSMSDESLDTTADAPWVAVKAGTTAAHLCGAAVLALLGFKRASLVWLFLLLGAMVWAATQGRGGMMAIIIPLVLAVIVAGKVREFIMPLLIAVTVIGVLYFLDFSIATKRSRDIGAGQLVDNFLSIFGTSEVSLDGTKLWRMNWWESIVNYTVKGPYFWTGKGFGVNLAISDGFLAGLEFGNRPLLRSPHNSHLTLLARGGVPGLALWLLTLLSWMAVMLANIVHARRRGDGAWAAFFLLIFCYALAFMVDATFDVALEGPMAGIWFWCLFGVGNGASLIYRATVPSEAEAPRDWQSTRHASGGA
jgi:hypothetical protein